jgi:hypothetical protein
MTRSVALMAALQQVLGAAAAQAVLAEEPMVRLGQLVLVAVVAEQAIAQMLEQVALEGLVAAVEAVVELHLTGLTLAQVPQVVLVLFVSIHGDPNDK